MDDKTLADRLWSAEAEFSQFEDELEELMGAEFEKLGHDYYDCSLEIWGAPDDARLNEKAQRLCKEAGFAVVYLNHRMPREEGKWETHYRLNGELPARGWRRRYVSDPTVATTRVIAGPEDNGYYEISHWPEGWDDPRSKENLANGYYRIVPDPLEKI